MFQTPRKRRHDSDKNLVAKLRCLKKKYRGSNVAQQDLNQNRVKSFFLNNMTINIEFKFIIFFRYFWKTHYHLLQFN